MRRKPRLDANQAEIVAALQAQGAAVTSMAAIGGGVADLLVSYAGRWVVLEVKDGEKPPSKRRLTPDEREWQARQKAMTYTVNDIAEALEAIAAASEERWRPVTYFEAVGDR